MALDHDPIALGAAVVRDHVVAQHVDPVVVQLVVLARDAVPVDGAVVVGVLLDIALFRVDQGLEIEDVRALATGQNVIRRDRLVGVELAVGQLVQRVALVAVRVVEDRPLAPVGAADQQVVAATAEEPVLAVAAVEDVASGAADHPVVAIAALQHVVAAPAVDHIVAAPAVQTVGPCGAGQLVAAAADHGGHGEGRFEMAMHVGAIVHHDLHEGVRGVVQLAEHRHQAVERVVGFGVMRELGIGGTGQGDDVGLAQLALENHHLADGALEQRMGGIGVGGVPGAAAADDEGMGVGQHALLEGRLGGDQIAVEPDLQALGAEGEREGIGGIGLQHEVRHLEPLALAGALLGDHDGPVLQPDREVAGTAPVAVFRDKGIFPDQPVQRETERERRVGERQRPAVRDLQIVAGGSRIGPVGHRPDNRIGGNDVVGSRHSQVPLFRPSSLFGVPSKRGEFVTVFGLVAPWVSCSGISRPCFQGVESGRNSVRPGEAS